MEITVNKLTGAGVLMTLAGLALLIFKLVAAAMSQTFEAAEYTLKGVMKAEQINLIETIGNSTIRNAAEAVITTPLYLHLIIIGILISIIAGIFSK